MNFSIKRTIGVFCLGVSAFSACSKDERANQNRSSQTTQTNAAQQATKDDVEELGKIVRLPAAPEEATYREENSGGRKLTAVLKFSGADAAQIVAAAEKYKPVAAAQIEAEDWFPAELVAQSQLSGDETLSGAAFAADDFFQPPFANGKLTRVGETNYFILELNAAS